MAIVKYLKGGTQQDNTRVSRPIIMLGIPYRLKPNEFYFVDKKTGKKTLIKRKLETISEDKRSNYLRLLDLNKTKQILKLLEQDKNYEKGIETIDALTKLALPSTYIGPLFNNNGKSYADNLISGEGAGNILDNLALDLFYTPKAIQALLQVPKLVTPVYNIAKKLYNKDIVINPIRNGYFNRVVEITKDFNPIQDALDTGIIRTSPLSSYNFPFFSYGKYPNPSFNINLGNKVVILGALSREIPFVYVDDFNNTIHARLPRTSGESATPLYNGTPNTAPANAFWYYLKGNGLIGKYFWFKHKFNTSDIPIPKSFLLQNNSNIMVHLDYGGSGIANETPGAYVKLGVLYPGKAKADGLLDYTWFNLGKPYAKGVQGKPFTNAFIIDSENVPSLIKVRDSKVPIGQWNGKKGFVLNSEYVSPDPINIDKGLLFELKDGKYILNPSFALDSRGYKFTSFDLSSPLKNGLWDMPTITLLVKDGGSKAVDFLGSQTRLNTYTHNRDLASRLGFGSIEEPYNSIARVRKPIKVKFNTNTFSNEGGSFIPGKTALLDIVEINLTHDIEPAVFHETLHRGSYGMGSLEGLDDMTKFKNTNRFYEYLSDKLKKPWSSQPTSMRDYLDKPGELPVNVLELGLRMGIQVGQKYPGKTKFNAIIDLFKRNNPNDGKLFILDYLNMDKPKRVWDALSGLYFTALPAIYGGYKATEE